LPATVVEYVEVGKIAVAVPTAAATDWTGTADCTALAAAGAALVDLATVDVAAGTAAGMLLICMIADLDGWKELHDQVIGNVAEILTRLASPGAAPALKAYGVFMP
jgi:hypothetical protein